MTSGWQWIWNASKAERLGKASNRLFVFSLLDAGITPEKILSQYPDLDEVHALNSDISKPIVFVAFKGKDQLVDGWHRLYKASLLGVDDLLAYFLTPEQAEACLILKLPPGQGLDWGQPPQQGRGDEHLTRSQRAVGFFVRGKRSWLCKGL